MSDLSLPPDYPTIPPAVHAEMQIVKLAREIAMGISELDDILKHHNLDRKGLDALMENSRFVAVLNAEIASWNSAVNTNERVKIKAGAMLEEWLPELYSRMNDRGEALNAKIEAGKLVERLAGMGSAAAKSNDSAVDRVSITINMGADHKLEFSKKLPPKVIDNETGDDVSSTEEVVYVD